MAAVISLLGEFDLGAFEEAAASSFDVAHAREIEKLQADLAARQASNEFGRCAKALDLFLRGVTIHHYLRSAYGLGELEAVLHLPLDGITMERLRKEPGGEVLPIKTITGLSNEDYCQYQNVAARVAAGRGELRVFLDDDYWAVRPSTIAV